MVMAERTLRRSSSVSMIAADVTTEMFSESTGTGHRRWTSSRASDREPRFESGCRIHSERKRGLGCPGQSPPTTEYSAACIATRPSTTFDTAQGNARFENCTFVGTTYVETTTECTHPIGTTSAHLTGSRTRMATSRTRRSSRTGGRTESGVWIMNTKQSSNNIVFDGCTFIGAIAGDRPGEYTHWRNKMQFTGPTRFYLEPDDADLQEQPDSDEILAHINAFTDEQTDYFSRSMLMMPGWSVDVGNFRNEQAEDWEHPVVNLRGVIIAGVLDARGTVDVRTLLMTRPRRVPDRCSTAAAAPVQYHAFRTRGRRPEGSKRHRSSWRNMLKYNPIQAGDDPLR